MQPAVSVQNVSKKFAHSLSKSLRYGFSDIARDLAGISSQPHHLRPDEFWGVRDADFDVQPSECLGLLGKNGAGKSTMLKMLNGIIAPDTGRIAIRGRVGALIEVGAGFHPLLTGRENVYINAAILGMSKTEVDSKLESIVDFADVREFLDTPVKFYSSGMFVRLGFSVAVHVNPEVLLIDEILAVGDFRFRAKCFTHLTRLMHNGTAVVLVSHNFEAIRRMCTHAAVFEHGHILFRGDPYEAVDFYQIRAQEEKASALEASQPEPVAGSGEILIKGLRFLDHEGTEKTHFESGETLRVQIEYEAKQSVTEPVFEILVEDVEQNTLHSLDTREANVQIGTIEGRGIVEVEYEQFNLLGGTYVISASVHHPGTSTAPYDTCFRQHSIVCHSKSKVRGRFRMPVRWNHVAWPARK